MAKKSGTDKLEKGSCYRFKHPGSGMYVTWGYSYYSGNMTLSPSGKQIRDLSMAMLIFDHMCKTPSKCQGFTADQMLLVKQKKVVHEEVIGTGTQIIADIKKQKEIAEKKKRYKEYLALRKEFHPEEPDPELPEDLAEEEAEKSASAIAAHLVGDL